MNSGRWSVPLTYIELISQDGKDQETAENVININIKQSNYTAISEQGRKVKSKSRLNLLVLNCIH